MKKASIAKTKQLPSETSSKNLWKARYSDGCSYDEFLKLCKLPCYYCGIEPYQIYKVATYDKRGIYSQYYLDNEGFIYNGLDRIDVSKDHSLDNIVSCCGVCNKFKRIQSQQEFYDWVKRITIKDPNYYIDFYQKLFEKIEFKIPNGRSLNSRHKISYSEFDYEYFYFLSQQKCFYCGIESSNQYNKVKYNGVDRILNEDNHNVWNCLPACETCNKAKLNHNIEFFFDKIYAIKQFNNLY